MTPAMLLTNDDRHFIAEGTHRRLYDILGAHPHTAGGMAGYRFAVWAPNARRVSVVGDWNHFDGRTDRLTLDLDTERRVAAVQVSLEQARTHAVAAE